MSRNSSPHKIFVWPLLVYCYFLGRPKLLNVFQCQLQRRLYTNRTVLLNFRWIQGGKIILVCLIIQPCVLNLWIGWWAIDFQVPERPFFFSVQIELNLYTWWPFFPLRFINFLFTHFTSILQKLSRLPYNSHSHLSLFCRGSLILSSCF